ncbi:MAG: immunoglobulin domain-containing protein [Verrucomicrobia bacterium]|nr:immunoglobulin domain-containing protein [Verrucomicrobiota bacterium]
MKPRTLTQTMIVQFGCLAWTVAALGQNAVSGDAGSSAPPAPEGRPAAAVSRQSSAANNLQLGVLTAEVYTGIGGATLTELRNSSKYRLNRPDRIEFANIFEYPPGTATQPPPNGTIDEYGVKLTGYIIPKETADYVFSIASDDNGELYLSSDESSAKQVRIARETQWNSVRQFASTARRTGCPSACENVSRPIRLEAGRRYSVRAEMKEGGGGDNLAVAWTKASQPRAGNGAVPILGEFLATDRRPPSPPQIVTHPQGQVVSVGTPVTLKVDVSGFGDFTYQWYRNGSPVTGAASATLTLSRVQDSEAGDYSVRVAGEAGSATSQLAPVRITNRSNFQLAVLSSPMPNPANGHIYYLLDASGWTNSEAAAVALGGHLVTINNSAEQTFVFSSFANFRGVARNPWIGLRDTNPASNSTSSQTRRSEFRWVSGETSTYSNWALGEPNNLGGEFNVQMWTSNGTWNDAIGRTALCGVVEVDASSQPPAITDQPQSQTLTQGSTVTLIVQAVGGTSLTYEWRKNGVVIPTANSANLTLSNVQPSDSGSYTVAVSNASGTTISQEAILSFPAEPESGAVVFNNRVPGTLDVRVLLPDGTPAGLGWMAQLFGGPEGGVLAPLLPATGFRTTSASALGYVMPVVVTVKGLKPGDKGTFVVRVYNGLSFETAAIGLESNPFTLVVGGGTIPPPNIEGLKSFTVVKNEGARPFVERQLPAAYTPGVKFTVSLKASPPSTISVYAVEDTPPEGWIVGIVTEGGLYDAANKKVKWGPFFDRNARALSYEITPPAAENGPKQFKGTSAIDGVNVLIGGDSTLDVAAATHPADNNPVDNRITIDEVTAYGLAWKKGASWPIGPNPIPIDYLTRAGALWKDGEAYRLDPAQGPAPKWWVNTPTPGRLSFHALKPAATGTSTAISVLPPLFVPGEAIQVRISLRPKAGVSAYAVEEAIPAGWATSNISDGGTLDAVNNQVKWGPFFDSIPRELAYDVASNLESPESVEFHGTASFDGESVTIAGQRQSRLTSRLKSLVLSPKGEFELEIKGRTGKELVVEASSNLIDWVAVGTVLNSTGKIKFFDPAAARELRFYRVITK